jgi:hypothetical protein
MVHFVRMIRKIIKNRYLINRDIYVGNQRFRNTGLRSVGFKMWVNEDFL